MRIEKERRERGQERGKEWEYRVIAVNKAGQGQPSNTVMAVLWDRMMGRVPYVGCRKERREAVVKFPGGM